MLERFLQRMVLGVVSALAVGCGGDAAPTGPTPTIDTVRFVLRASTARRSDLTPSQIQCADSTGATHLHASWRQFLDTPMDPVGNDRYQVTMTDVPVGQVVQITVWDQNSCAGESIGYVRTGVSANDVDLRPIAAAGNAEPGFAFTVDGRGRVTP
jgi:hypothetical protein